MSRYSSLCVFFIISALFGGTIAAPQNGQGEGSSAGGDKPASSGREAVKNFGKAVGKGFAAVGVKMTSPFKSKWEGVTYSEVANEKGVLKLETDSYAQYYQFYPESTLKDGHSKGVTPNQEYRFALGNVSNATRNAGTMVVNFKLVGKGEKQFSLTFANDSDTKKFLEQVSQLKKEFS